MVKYGDCLAAAKDALNASRLSICSRIPDDGITAVVEAEEDWAVVTAVIGTGEVVTCEPLGAFNVALIDMALKETAYFFFVVLTLL